VRQILAIDLGTDLLPALALGMEKPEPDVMSHPPRRRGARLIDNGLLMRSFLWLGMIEAVLCYIGFFAVYLFSGNWVFLQIPFTPPRFITVFDLTLTPEQAQLMAITVFHAGVVLSQVGNAYACRTEKLRNSYLGWFSNRYLLLGILVELIGIWSIVNFEFLAKQFEHVQIPYRYWAGLAFFPLILYSMEWIRKRIVRQWEARAHQTQSNMED
jgi:magnesium-transporting ATPase (P-type)